jgi:PEP-CTERM motif
MRILSKLLPILAATAVLAIAPAALADTASMYLYSAGNNAADGVYVGPYTAQINGGPNTPVICDDFTHDSYVGENWVANISTMPSLTYARFNPANYDQVAYLAEVLFGLGNNPSTYAEADAVQFAIWSINDPGAGLNTLTFGASSVDSVSYWLTQAADQHYWANEFSNIVIYTPQSGGNPQEFIMETPEPSAILLLAAGLFGLLLLAQRRRRALSAC